MAPPRPLAVVAALLALLALGAASVVRIGPVPRLLPFLDPVRGVWAVAGAARPPAEHRAAIPGLTAEVDVRVDHRGVPHIFAATQEDAYRAMGYLVARDRLFQLELQTRAAAGTLTELLGAQLLEADRLARRMGLAWSAERKLRALDPASLGARAIYAYADGVNAYLDGLRSDRLPLEYRLLDRRPTRWEPLHSLLLFARMGTPGQDQPLMIGQSEGSTQRRFPAHVRQGLIELDIAGNLDPYGFRT